MKSTGDTRMKRRIASIMVTGKGGSHCQHAVLWHNDRPAIASCKHPTKSYVMVRSLTLSLALVMATGLAAQTPGPVIHGSSGKLTLHFQVASATIDKADEAALHALCDRTDIARVAAITLIGHTDVRGTFAYNEALSERRAEAVSNALRSTCLEGKPVRVGWSGEKQPVALGSDEIDHALNRRVDVHLEYPVTAELPARPNAHPRVVPLLPTIDKPKEHYRVNAAEAIDLTMSDGVRVRIPAGAIVNADGTPVNAHVDLSYRGFTDPYEIIASGIPMHIRTDAGTQHMETAGMYELYASLNGEPLGLAPGASITLQQPQAPALDPAFVGWELDPTTGTWVQGGTLTTAAAWPAQVPSPATEATALYWTKLWQLEAEKRPDSVRFADRRSSGRYCHLTSCDTATPGGSWVKQRNRFKPVARVPEIHVVGYKGIYDPDHVLFAIEFRGRDDEQFPEWRRLPYRTVWEYTGPEPRAVFKRLYGKRHYFQDIGLSMAPGGNDGVIRLKENGDWLELPVSAKWDRSKPMRSARWDRALVLYDKQLAKRTLRFDRDVARNVARYNREHLNMPLTAWKKARTAMDSLERPMELDPWREYASTRRPIMWNLNANQARDLEAVQTSFGLQDFGVFNIDRIMKMQDQQNVLAAAVDAEGKPWPWVNGFAVLNNENSVITYWGSGKGTGDNFLVSPGRMKSLFLVDAEGRIARADVAPLNRRDPRVVLKVTPIEDPKSVDELRAQAAP
ncbi:MAG: OmpA family protein [Flavobacteriales bacterium]|nr:OmpA family protein [Flavobacteriales bacterium]